MVDYTNELRNLRKMTENHLLRYGTNHTSNPSEEEIRGARAIRQKITDTWSLAIRTDCIDSETELIEAEDTLYQLARRRNYNL